MTTLPEATIRRLILSKHMLLNANRQINDSSEIGCVLAIQAVDYAIEMLLKTIVSHFGAPHSYEPPESGYYNSIKSLSNQKYSPRGEFNRLWDEVQGIFRDPAKGINIQYLPLRKEIEVLHSIRNDVQHNGIIPSVNETRKYVAYAESFLQDVTASAFGQDITLMSLSSLIKEETIRTLVLEAEVELESGDYKKSIIAATKAFEMTVAQDRKVKAYRRKLRSASKYDFKRMTDKIDAEKAFDEFASSISRDFSFRNNARRAAAHLDFKKFLDGLTETLIEQQQQMQTMQETVEVQLLGVELREYARFRSVSPQILTYFGGETGAISPRDWEPTKTEATEVLSFVFDTIVRWQEKPIRKHIL